MPLFAFFKKHKSPQAATTDSPMKHSSTSSANGRILSPSDADTLVESFHRLSFDSRQPRRQEASGGRPNANGDYSDGYVRSSQPRHEAMDWESTAPTTLPRRLPPSGNSPLAFPIPQTYPTVPGSLPTPPTMAMPIPQTISRTMAYAFTGELPAAAPPPPTHDTRLSAPHKMTRPHSDSGTFPSSGRSKVSPAAPQRPQLQSAPHSAPAKPVSSGPSRPPSSSVQTPPRRQRASSSPPSPTSVSSSSGKGVIKVQCCATTKQDKRCTRMVPVSTPLALLSGEEEPQYCHQHVKNAFIDVKFRSRKDPALEVMYADWIPEYLQESTKTVLREEMQKEVSPADESGYIYAYEIDDGANPNVVHIKVGRAVKLTKRLAEWDKQCQSKQTHLLGFWPMSRDAAQNGMMRGRVQVGEPGPWCHRVERLVHLELADLALNAPYVDPQFPNTKSGAGDSNRRMPARRPCPDCGAMHREIFTFPRATGRYEGKEWEEIVRPVIEKWGGFVEAYL